MKQLRINEPTSGGKAGKALNRTGTVQVLEGDFLVKQFRYEVGNLGTRSRAEALRKAAAFIQREAEAP